MKTRFVVLSLFLVFFPARETLCAQIAAANSDDPGRPAPELILQTGHSKVVEAIVRNQSGGEDSFTFGQGGGVLGGTIKENRLFYFISGEYQMINTVREKSFAVPTVDQRGAFGTGTSGIFRNFFDGTLIRSTPVNERTGAIFSLFPFPNDPTGVYGVNTYTQALPASGRGAILSGRLDNNFEIGGRQHVTPSRHIQFGLKYEF